MNYTSLFYWITVADNAKVFFIAFIVIFTIVAVVSTFGYFINVGAASSGQTAEEKEGQKISRKWIFWSYPFMILFWGLYVFTPSKKDSLLIVGGGGALNYLTQDSTAKQIPSEFLNYVKYELKNLANDAKVELEIESQKDKILKEVKGLTADQLIERMRSDSNLSKIILNK